MKLAFSEGRNLGLQLFAAHAMARAAEKIDRIDRHSQRFSGLFSNMAPPSDAFVASSGVGGCDVRRAGCIRDAASLPRARPA